MSSSSLPSPGPVTVDDWGVQVPNIPRKVPKKRKSSTSIDFSLTPSVLRYRFSGNGSTLGALMMGCPIYDAISRSDDTFMELLMESMSEEQLRNQMARVSMEWCGLAYKVLRRRICDRVFAILYAVRPDASDISLQQFFHPNILCRKPLTFSEDELSNALINKCTTKSNKPVGYLNRLTQPAEVQGIISFGNAVMEEELLSCHEELELPHVEVFVYILSEAIFFTSPDLKNVGDSFNGLKKSKPGDWDIKGGRFFSSLLFPRSQHFALDLFTLAYGNERWSLEEEYGRKLFYPSFLTKAIVVFQTYEDPVVDIWITDTMIKALKTGSKKVFAISSVYNFVGTSLIKSNTAVSAVSIAFMGDSSTSVISVKINLGQRCSEVLEKKFAKMSFFIDDNKPVSDSWTVFALLFCHFLPEAKDVFAHINGIMQMFVARFPTVPIQAITSVADIRHQKAASCVDLDLRDLDLSMKRLTTSNSKSDSYSKQRTRTPQKAVILLVKYPLQSNPANV